MRIIDDMLCFDSGKPFSETLVSVTEDGKVYDRYDGVVCHKEDLPRERRRELAEYQIGLWKKFGDLE